jgi:hypothetical protein
MGGLVNAADSSGNGGGARTDAPQTVPPAGRGKIARMAALRPFAGARRNIGRVSWRTVPAFTVGVLATLAAALAVLCRGPARADSAVTDRIVRWWAAVWRTLRGRG